MRELNRLGLTSIIDAGGGFQNYPEDYAIIEELHKRGEMTLRIAYNLFTQKPKQEKEDFARWIKMTGPGKGDDFFRCNGAGEMLVFSAADFEDFLEPRPDLPASLEGELKDVVSLLAANKWPFRLHATYDESITRFLNVFEEVNRDVPFKGLNWFFDHCETVSDRNLERIKALGGGIAIQHRMAYQGEYFMDRYGKKAAERTPPVRKMLELGIPVGAGTDATRVASYNPWVSFIGWSPAKTVGGVSMYPDKNCLSREEALRLYTQGSSWFSSESGKKGAIAAGQLADFVALTDDYLSVPEETNQRHRIRSHHRWRKNCSRDGRIHSSRTAADPGAAGMVAQSKCSAAMAHRWTFARRRGPERRWPIVTPPAVANTAACTRCINSTPALERPAIATRGSGEWAVTASHFDVSVR